MKRMNYGFIGIFSLIFIMFSSCEKVLDIDIPFKKRKIVVNGIMNPDSLVRVHVSKSMHILDNQDIALLDNAHLNLYEDGVFIDSIPEVANGLYELPGFKPAIDHTYRIEVTAENRNPVEAETTIPKPVSIISIDTNRVKGQDSGNSLQFSLQFKDPPGVENYYIIRAKVYRQFSEWDHKTDSLSFYYNTESIGLNSNDPVIDEHSSGLIFSDDYFKGKTYNMTFTFSSFYHGYYGYEEDVPERDKTYQAYIYLHSISKEYYLYLKSFYMQMYAQDDPFAEPVTVYNNIKNGYGVLGSFAVSVDTLNIPYESYDYGW